MTPKPPCCGPCRTDMQSCRVDVACCTNCHFSWEERHCFPHLPASARHILQTEHKRLKEAGYPRLDVLAHSAHEMMYFRAYCPPDLVAQVERDHQEYEAGNLHSRRSA